MLSVTGTSTGRSGAALLPAGGLTGVARVVDGDTLSVNRTRIRLDGIDAPESQQTCRRDGATWSCGAAATAELASLVSGRLINCTPSGRDQYGRTLATCFADGTNVNGAMVRRGYAWAYARYSWRYLPEQTMARFDGVGIWGGEAEPAWQYRRR
jgi:endonuclease YncB( thermonuclease family)